MKQMILEKLDENPVMRVWFYLTCTYGIIAGCCVIMNAERYRQYAWYLELWIVVVLFIVGRAACKLLWWFGDHPEE